MDIKWSFEVACVVAGDNWHLHPALAEQFTAPRMPEIVQNNLDYISLGIYYLKETKPITASKRYIW